MDKPNENYMESRPPENSNITNDFQRNLCHPPYVHAYMLVLAHADMLLLQSYSDKLEDQLFINRRHWRSKSSRPIYA